MALHDFKQSKKVIDVCGNAFTQEGNEYVCTHVVKHYYSATEMAELETEHANRRATAQAADPQAQIDAANAAISTLRTAQGLAAEGS